MANPNWHFAMPIQQNMRYCPVHARLVPMYPELPTISQQLHYHNQWNEGVHMPLQPFFYHQRLVYHYIPPSIPNFCPATRNHCPSFPSPTNPFLRNPILHPPLCLKDYSQNRNLPAPPYHLIYDSCKHKPDWWTDNTTEPINRQQGTTTAQSIAEGLLSLPEILEVYQLETNPDPNPRPQLFVFPTPGDAPWPVSSEEPSTFSFLLSKEEPNYSLTALAGMAISSSTHKIATLSEIYTFISTTFPFYEKSKRAWKNSVRNCLMNNKCFQQVPSLPGTEEKSRKVVYWMINPSAKSSYLKGSFQCKRKSASTKDVKERKASSNVSHYFRTIPNANTTITEFYPPVKKQKCITQCIAKPLNLVYCNN